MPDQEKKHGCNIIINCGDGHDGHHGGHDRPKKSSCCDACAAADQQSAFVGSVDLGSITPVAVEIPFALLTNPAGSGKNLVITSRGLAVTGSDDETALVKFYFDPTVTANGTPAAPVNLNAQTPALPGSLAQFWTSPGLTVSANGTLIDALNTGSGQSELTGKVTLGEGHSLLVTGRANAENTRAAAFLHWTECEKPQTPPTPGTGGSTPPPGGSTTPLGIG